MGGVSWDMEESMGIWEGVLDGMKGSLRTWEKSLVT